MFKNTVLMTLSVLIVLLVAAMPLSIPSYGDGDTPVINKSDDNYIKENKTSKSEKITSNNNIKFDPDVTFNIAVYNNSNIENIIKNNTKFNNCNVYDYETKDLIFSNNVSINSKNETRGQYYSEYDVTVFGAGEINLLPLPDFLILEEQVDLGMKVLSLDNFNNSLERFGFGGSSGYVSTFSENETRIIGFYRCPEVELNSMIFLFGNNMANEIYTEAEIDNDTFNMTSETEIINRTYWYEPNMEELLIEGFNWCLEAQSEMINANTGFNETTIPETRTTPDNSGYLSKYLGFVRLKKASSDLNMKIYTTVYRLDDTAKEVYLIKQTTKTYNFNYVSKSHPNAKVGYFAKNHFLEIKVDKVGNMYGYIYNQGGNPYFPSTNWAISDREITITKSLGMGISANLGLSGRTPQGQLGFELTGGVSISQMYRETEMDYELKEQWVNSKDDDKIKWKYKYSEAKFFKPGILYRDPSRMGDYGVHEFSNGVAFRWDENNNALKPVHYTGQMKWRCYTDSYLGFVNNHYYEIKPVSTVIQIDPLWFV